MIVIYQNTSEYVHIVILLSYILLEEFQTFDSEQFLLILFQVTYYMIDSINEHNTNWIWYMFL